MLSYESIRFKKLYKKERLSLVTSLVTVKVFRDRMVVLTCQITFTKEGKYYWNLSINLYYH